MCPMPVEHCFNFRKPFLRLASSGAQSLLNQILAGGRDKEPFPKSLCVQEAILPVPFTNHQTFGK